MKRKNGFFTTIVFAVAAGLIILMVATGILSYISVYNESVSTIRHQNSALVNRLEGWLNVRSNQLTSNLAFLLFHLDGEISAETMASAFTLQEDWDETISMIMVGLPPCPETFPYFYPYGSFIHGGVWVDAVETYAPGRIWYAAAAERPGEIFFLPPYWGPATQRFVFTVVRTINDYDTSDGVIAMSIPFYIKQNLIAEISEIPSGYSFVLDETGDVLFHPNPDYSPVADGVFLNIHDIHGYEGMLDAIMHGGTFMDNGSTFVGEQLAGTGWYVITQIPTSYVVARTIPTLISLLVVGFFALAAAMAALIFFRSVRGALEKLSQASMAKSAFIANLSHEIRTPMNSIVGFSELALEDDDREKTRMYLRMITENAHWLLQIVNDVLDISKIESGKMEIDDAPFSLIRTLARCESDFLPMAKEKGIILQFQTDPLLDNFMVMGDQIRLRQVFTNLLSNAIKFTKSGDIRVLSTVKKGEETASGEIKTVYFEVKDSGIGMSPGQIEKIFEPFTQADASITREYGGTGLGLSIVQNLLQMMGGELSVESEPGVGSSFSFELSFVTAPPEAEEVLSGEPDNYRLEGEVLVCEDNKMNQLVIGEHLKRLGLSCVIAENGKIGVDLVKQREKSGMPFSLIFMDIYMPVMDGLEATNAIKKMKCDTPIVAMTANVMDCDREIYEKHGMVSCIDKPFTSRELWRCLQKFLEPRPAKAKPQSDEKLQQVLEASFVEYNQTFFAEISESINRGDIKTAHRLAHTLKSSAGLIGKSDLQRAALHLESRLASGEHTPEDLYALEKELKAVLEELADIRETHIKTEEGEKPKILIVDDAPLNLKALTYILGEDYKIFTAKDGPTALEIAREQKPALILLDIIMPGMDGCEVLAHLKANKETRDIPVVFVSGADADMEDTGLALGAADFLHKPYTPNIAKMRVRNQMRILELNEKIKGLGGSAPNPP